jgi:hypothetical protein
MDGMRCVRPMSNRFHARDLRHQQHRVRLPPHSAQKPHHLKEVIPDSLMTQVSVVAKRWGFQMRSV